MASSTTTTTQRTPGAAGSYETMLRNSQIGGFSQLQGLVGAGPNQADVMASLAEQRAQAERGGLATSEDLQKAGGIADSLLAPQTEAFNQATEQHDRGYRNQAALMGRGALDPVLNNMAARDYTAGQQSLAAQRSQLTGELGQQLNDQRNDLLSSLSQQAVSNRQALMSLGSGIQQSEQNYRLNTALNKQTEVHNPGAGEIIGAIAGGLGSIIGIGSGLFGKGGAVDTVKNIVKPGGGGSGGSSGIGMQVYGQPALPAGNMPYLGVGPFPSQPSGPWYSNVWEGRRAPVSNVGRYGGDK